MPQLGAQGNAVADKLQSAIGLLNSAVDVKRRVMEDLHPTVLEQFGLAPALQWLAESFAARSGLRPTVVLGPNISLGREQSVDLFRVAQESLTNITKHARATAFSIALETDGDHVTLSIKDNGKGADPKAFDRTLTHGLRGVRQRVARWGGKVAIGNVQGSGVMVSATIPVSPAV